MSFIPQFTAILVSLIAVSSAPAMERLPDGGTAVTASGAVDKAWYIAPTNRYDHGVLGDSIEAGGLAVQTRDGSTITFVLDETLVFEDITPRLADLNGDGQAEIITIVTSIRHGASLAVFALDGPRLKLAAKTDFIGKAHRWLNVAGLADFNGDGRTDIAIVKTPHLGGPLEFWDLADGRLRRIGFLAGFSNHVIGTRDLDLSATVDTNSDGKQEILVPSADRRTLRHVEFSGGKLREINGFTLNGKAVRSIRKLGRSRVILQLDDGKRQTISLE